MKYMEAREVRNCSLDDLNKMIKLLAFAKSDQVRTEINKQHKFKLEKQINYEQQQEEVEQFIDKYRKTN